MNFLRTLIVGNSGSGKSWLAERIAHRMGSPCIDLDSIHWLPGGYNVARERSDAVQLLRDAAKADRWVIEGIYGSLANEIRTDSTALIWLCLDEAECVANIRQRGMRRGGDAASFAALLDWASTYRRRQGPSSYIGHQRLFGDYGADKQVLRSRDAVMAFLDRWETQRVVVAQPCCRMRLYRNDRVNTALVKRLREEFVVVLPETSATGAAGIAERIRDAIAGCGIEHGTSEHGRVTASIGVVSRMPGTDDDLSAAIKAADEALYYAKADGRNRVSLYESS